MADPIDNQNDRNVGLISRQQEQKIQQHQQNHRNERGRRMQKMQEIFLPGRLWEWRALLPLPYRLVRASRALDRRGRVSGNRIEEMAVLKRGGRTRSRHSMPWAFEHEDIANEHEQAAQV
jgi:hypothetical protein